MKNLIITLLFCSTAVLAQELNLAIHNTYLQEYLTIEEALGGEMIPATSYYHSSNGEAQPLIFLRKEHIIPDLTVYYFFKEEDSTMSYVLYEWDVSNFEKTDNNQKSKEFQEALIAKYKALKQDITDVYGEPKVRRNYSNVSRADPENTFEESATWHPNDSTEIEMYTTVSNYYMKKGAMTINPVHRIRLYVRKKPIKRE